MNYKLDHIVREFLIESYGAEQLDKRYSRFMQIATSGLRELHMDAGWRKTVVTLPIEDNDTVPIPSDYIDYYRVSLCFNGVLIGLSHDRNECPPRIDECGNVKRFTFRSDDTPDTQSGFFFGYNYDEFSKDGQFVGRDFGVGGGRPLIGTFSVHEKEGYFVVRGMANNEDIGMNEIVLEYLASVPRDNDGDLTVHPYDVEAIKAWMHWKSIQRLRSTSGGSSEEARRIYGIEKKKSRMRHNALSTSEWVQAIRTGYRSSPKI